MIDRLVALSHTVILSDGWARRAMALGAGALGALAQAPLGLIPAFALSFPVAVWLLDGAQAEGARFSWSSARAAARDGWWFGFGYFLAGLWWIGAAFLVETDEFAWAMPLGVIGLPAVLAVFTALGFVVSRLFWSAGSARIFALALGVGVSEWLRHVAFTGFPWNSYGQGFASSLTVAQGASVIGADGLSLLAVLVFAAPATLVDARPGAGRWRFVQLAALGLVLLAGFGLARLWLDGGFNPGVRPLAMVADVKIRLVQPNTSQRDKILQRDGLATVSKLIALSDRAVGPQATGMSDVTHVVWPESPFPSIISRDSRALAEIARLVPARTTLLTGAVRMEDQPGGVRRYFNTLHVFGPRASILRSYDKQHLVPFGEYLPLESVLSAVGLRRFVHAPGAFTAGAEKTLLEVPGLPPVLPLICYEAIFPYEIRANEPRPGMILNITNDAWFGETFGPHQHFAQARLRAIEFGLPLIRVANTGISAVVDPHGRVLASIGVGVESITDVFLPKGLASTLYSSYGMEIRIASLLLVGLLAVFLGLIQEKTGGRRRGDVP